MLPADLSALSEGGVGRQLVVSAILLAVVILYALLKNQRRTEADDVLRRSDRCWPAPSRRHGAQREDKAEMTRNPKLNHRWSPWPA